MQKKLCNNHKQLQQLKKQIQIHGAIEFSKDIQRVYVNKK